MNARGAATVVFGEALVDDYVSEQVVGGAPFNVARHLAAFMAPQLMITRIGSDKNGAVVRAEFERFAMSEAGLQVDPMEETGRVVVERRQKAHRFVILPGQADERCVFRSLHAADIVKVNEEELQALFEWYFQIDPSMALDSEEVRASCRALLQMFALEALIVTLGHRGSVYFGADGTLLIHRDNPAPPFVLDTVGAGDGFAAIFLLGRARGWPLELTLARANEFAGALCAITGAVPQDMGFYDKWVARWRAA